MNRRSFLIAPIALAVLAGPAHADLSKKVIAAFKGKLLVTRGPVEAGASDKDTIAHFKKTALIAVESTQNGNDVWEWAFVYTGFLKTSGATSLTLEFWSDGNYAADQTLTGVDPKLTVVEGDIVIDEDEGLTKGKTYTLKLVGNVKGKEVVFAQSAKILFR